jgi:hypothetical protein
VKKHVEHRIVWSVLAALGVIAVTPAVTFAAGSAATAAEIGVFGQAAGSSVAISATLEVARTTCPDGNACFWEQQDFTGDRKIADGGDAGPDWYLGANDRSMKNRLSNRRVVIKDVDLNVLDCINPGGERSNLAARAGIFKIGASGSSC